MSEKLKVGILGGTGMVGQRFIALLENHPWFEVTTIAASPRSAGKTYEEAVGGRWKLDTPMPEAVKGIKVMNVNEVESVASQVDFVFSAVDMSKEEIKKIEEDYARTETPVVSNNSAHRWTSDVPMMVPEINPEHMEVIESQKKRLGTKRGFVAVKPNCSIQSYAPVLTAWMEFEPEEVVATTYQAISGAGKTFQDWPEMAGNIIPYIGGEEEKSEKEPLRIWGEVKDGVIVYTNENQIYSASDPTFHAEAGLLRGFCAKTQVTKLSDYTLYSSCEPCFMCSGAIVWTKLGRLVYAASNRDLNQILQKEGCACSDIVFTHSSYRPEVTAGVLRKESLHVLKKYFSSENKQSKNS